MKKSEFYLQLLILILSKYCNNSAEITEKEFENILSKKSEITHKIKENGNLEIILR